MRTMEHEDPYVRLFAYGKVKRMMKEFQGRNIDALESNMMRGMFKRKLKDFSEKIQNNTDTLLEKLRYNNGDEDDEEMIAKLDFKQRFV